MVISLYALCLGFLLDLIFGDPHWLPHPVRLMGRAISGLEKALRPRFPDTPQGRRSSGRVMVILVLLIFTAAPLVILLLCQRISPFLRLAVETVMCYQLLAARSLRDESMKVYDALCQDDLSLAREKVSMIVGRDTQKLSREQVAKAAVETVAENTSDGVVAPLFYMAIGGGVLGFFYKAANTMDSMVGYRNERYEDFGRAAAKLDDIVNFIPSRLSALLMIIAAVLPGYSAKDGWKIWRRDRFQHKSPNSAQTESVCAGALGVQLAGDASYFGVLVRKPTIGDPLRPVETQDIRRANRLMLTTAILSLLFLGGAKALLILATGGF
ncbi:adenosylcobinamide-phosphate synthase CbiB [Zongyangia sp. HA2173]|uniref:adenosylcobinamide-phosphate synthase CbiB n=1 Tax=Zongyangia sp. HA2173 TaxID=3133035 RepID=UPI00316997FC